MVIILDNATSWELLFLYDAIVFALTAFKAYHEWSAHKFLGGHSLLTLIIRDGMQLSSKINTGATSLTDCFVHDRFYIFWVRDQPRFCG